VAQFWQHLITNLKVKIQKVEAFIYWPRNPRRSPEKEREILNLSSQIWSQKSHVSSVTCQVEGHASYMYMRT